MEYFIAYFGFSNCAGYLFNQGITQPTRSGKIFQGIPDNIDIITGMLRDDNKTEIDDEMDEDEKEAEAQKLFEMIDRLNKNGIIKMVPK